MNRKKRISDKLGQTIAKLKQSDSCFNVGEVLALLANDRHCHVKSVLNEMISPWEIGLVVSRLQRCKDTLSIEELDRTIYNIDRDCPVLHTGHLLLWVTVNRKTDSYKVLESFSISSTKVAEILFELPDDEDFYLDMDSLINPSKEEYEEHDDKYEYAEFGFSLTDKARKGELEPIFCRQKEMLALIEILLQRKKSNPVIVGEAGVGKTAIVEGLAQQIVEGRVPEKLRDKEIFSVDVASLVAGTKYRGEFEKRLVGLLNRIKRKGNVIMFIDEIHTIVGTGSSSVGSLDIANILKPLLSSAEIMCIGATTKEEYSIIESHAALSRRFQRVDVLPTTSSETLSILKNIKHLYEAHHKVVYSEDALRMFVEISDSMMHSSSQPDKAIELMDRTGARLSLKGVKVIYGHDIEINSYGSENVNIVS